MTAPHQCDTSRRHGLIVSAKSERSADTPDAGRLRSHLRESRRAAIRIVLSGAVALTAGLVTCRAAEVLEGAAGSRIFEMRTYSLADDKVQELAHLFGEKLPPLFAKHGISVIAFFVPQDDKGTFICILAHQSRLAATNSWKMFLADPDVRDFLDHEGKSIRDMNLKVVSVYVNPMDYSPLK